VNHLSGLWAEIANDSLPAGAIVRRLLPHLRHDVFVGQQRPSGERFLELRLYGPIGNLPHKDPSSKGLGVKVVLESAERAVVSLRERSKSSTSQFEDLVDDVLALLSEAPGDGAAARIVERIIAWQDFFTRQVRRLSAESAAGLFAELTILNDVMIPAIGGPAAVNQWTGPDPALQDFQFRGGAVEVKSFRGTGSGSLAISSERQLDLAGTLNLVLAYVELDERKNGSGSTLLDVIRTSRRLVQGSPSALAELGDKLLSFGWLESHADYLQERYVTRVVEFFSVVNGFPRITPDVLPNGVGHVQYRIDRSAIQPFVISQSELYEVLGIADD
jgi:hypothetical protein